MDTSPDLAAEIAANAARLLQRTSRVYRPHLVARPTTQALRQPPPGTSPHISVRTRDFWEMLGFWGSVTSSPKHVKWSSVYTTLNSKNLRLALFSLLRFVPFQNLQEGKNPGSSSWNEYLSIFAHF
eukprot:5896258-Amphidinium_carterae.1